ncbi:28S ribosomal protein S11, mitochondrial-like isoform X2 [Anneissia japonica]|uniref:28S ribosomal protein S11, mitochondrial-like isoform X2 n=1 Tax=Anneissia japonica TaxID=1529436 RepID=UPI0014259D39|nr:28S ribosomal protein S11, mitochondrial-like isoform X2 [Anneissia japonica]
MFQGFFRRGVSRFFFLASRFQQIIHRGPLFNLNSLTPSLKAHPALRSCVHTCPIRCTSKDTVNKVKSAVIAGSPETGAEVDAQVSDKKPGAIIPDLSTSLVFNGVPFDDIPIANIKATWNNTHIIVVDPTNVRKYISKATCGSEGFKNAKKGTSVAAQTAAIAAATRAAEKGVKMVRVMVKGIGPGRQASIKGLQMGGLEIISITDNTPVPHNGCRPRKARRL